MNILLGSRINIKHLCFWIIYWCAVQALRSSLNREPLILDIFVI